MKQTGMITGSAIIRLLTASPMFQSLRKEETKERREPSYTGYCENAGIVRWLRRAS